MTLLEKLAPYLPYDVKIQEVSVMTPRVVYTARKLNAEVLNYFDLTGIKPILRPLSDLFKYVDYNDGSGEVMLGYRFGVVKITDNEKDIYIEEVQAHEGSNPIANIDITDINLWLFKYHFDVFNMIEDGLAIDINTLNK